MNNTQPENNQPPSWFVDTGAPVVPAPAPSDPARKKKLIIVLSIVALVILASAGIALYVASVQSAKQSAVRSFRTAYTSFYTTLSSIDDRLEPEGVDPADIASKWQAYKDSLTALKQSPIYTDNKNTIDTIESLSSPYGTFATDTIPQLAVYMTDCTYNDEAGLSLISESCISRLQTITDSPGSPAHPIAKRLLGTFSNAKSNNLMTEADIANVRDFEGKMFALPSSFTESVGPEITKLSESVGINVEDE